MAHNFEMDMNFGDDRSLTGLRALRHPVISMVHVGLRTTAVVFYVLANFFVSSFIIQFLTLLTLHCLDLWVVKNITGRLMVGLRWWSFVDEEGKNHWKFEVSKDLNKYDPLEYRIFWGALVAGPFFWALLVCVAFLTFQWQWMIVAMIGAGMTFTNLYGYLRCHWSTTQEMTNYFTRWAFFSMIKRNYQPNPGADASGSSMQKPHQKLAEII